MKETTSSSMADKHPDLYLKGSIENTLSPEKLLILENGLENNEAYFISWLADLPLVGKIFQSCKNYLYFSKGPGRIEEEIKNEYNIWKIQTLRETTKPLVKAFLSISLGNEDLAKKNVSWVEKVVKHCIDKNIFSEEYAEGIIYLCKLLKIHTNQKFSTLEEKDYETFMSCSFENISGKGKVLVWLTKCEMRDLFKERNSAILKQMISLDPENWLWSWELYHELKEMGVDETLPSKEETDAILCAMELSKLTKYHSMCISEFCVAIAEIMNHRKKNNLPNTPLDLGSQCFESNEDVVDFIKSNAGEAFKSQSTFLEARTIESYGYIFSKVLPTELNDLTVAKMYTGTYLKILRDHCDGKPENERFLIERKRMYRAFIEQIQLCLKSCDQNTEMLEDIFLTVWEYDQWEEHEKYSLHFLHGCYFSIKEDVQSALMHWLEMDFHGAATAKAPSFLFIDFAYAPRIRRYSMWPNNVNLNLDKVLVEILKRLSQEDLPVLEKGKLKTLKIKLEEAMKLEIVFCQSQADEDEISDLKTDGNEANLKHLCFEELKSENLTSSEDAQLLHNGLKSCETYFVHWLNGYDVTKKKLVTKTWFHYDEVFEPKYQTEEAVKEEFSVYNKATLRTIVNFLVEAFLNMTFGNADLGGKNISWAEYAITHCVSNGIFSEEYGDGFKYLCNLLKIHSNLKLGMESKCDHDQLSSSSFDQLPSKGKTIVYFAKVGLISLFNDRLEECVPILKEMLSLDGNNWLWAWKLFDFLNLVRLVNNISLPSDEEIEAVSKAVALSETTEYHSLCLSDFCMTLAEIVGHRIRNDLPNSDIYVDEKTFKSNEDAVEFITLKARETLNDKNIFNLCNNREAISKYARIFRHTLPFLIRDFELTKACEQVYSNLTSDDRYDDYEVFLKAKQKDYRESIDMIQTLLEHPEENSLKLENVFKAIWKQDKNWKDHEIYSLHFLHGCYFLAKEDTENAVMHWLQMDFNCDFDMNFLFIDFAILPRIKNHYNWSNFNLGIAQKEILNKIHDNNIPIPEKEKLAVLKFKIENAMKVDIHCKWESVTGQDMNWEVQYSKEIKKSCLITKKESECLQNDLERCETYFMVWLGDYEITTKMMLSMTETIYYMIRVPDQQTEEELKEGFSLQTIHTFQNVIAPLVEAFFNILSGNIDLAIKNISWVEYATIHCVEVVNYISEEYAEGIKYVCGLVKIHAHLKLGIGTRKHFEDFNNLKFKNLTDKGKTMVFVAKWMFNDQFHDRKSAAILDLKQVVSLDIKNWIWNFLLCSKLRYLRRQNTYSAPDEDEITAIARSVDYSVSSSYYHPLCVSGLCQCLAEILNHRWHEKLPNTPIDIGTQVFPSEEDVVEFIKTKARNAFKETTFGFSGAMRYGDIFSSLLHFKHRDYELAEKCFKLCLERTPSNSKANHRMGTLQLNWKGDVKQAIHFFKLAVQFTPKNFPAWSDMIVTLLGSPRENQKEIEDSFQTFWGQRHPWSEDNKFSIHFLEGCYLAMKGEISKAVSLWTDHNSHTSSSERATDFHQLERISKRYKWPGGVKINFEDIIGEINTQLRTASVEVVAKLNLLKVKIENEIYRKNCKYNYSSTAGSNFGSTAGSTYGGRHCSTWQSRSTVADKVSSWRMSNLPDASNDHDDFVPEQVAPSPGRYIPPPLRARENINQSRDQPPNRGGWR